MPTDVKELLLSNKLLSALNENWRSYHQEVANFCLPDRAWITTPKITGERMKFNYLYDTRGILSLDTMVNGFQSYLTNPSTKWFGLEPELKELKEDKASMVWFNDVRDAQIMSLNRSNFSAAQKEFYKQFGCFGSACLTQLEDYKTKVKFCTIPIDQVNFEEDDLGRVVAVYRTFKLKALQAHRLWGENAGKSVVEAIAQKKYFNEFEFLHYAGPREYRDVTKFDSKNLPIKSCWVAVKDEHLILESGYKSLPFHVARASKAFGDSFGYSQAMKALAAIKLINAQKKTTLRGAMKAIDPALSVPSRGFILPINLNPAAMNYRLDGTAGDSIQAMPGGGRIEIGIEMMNMERADIEEFFYVPIFKAFSQITKQMTVPEVQKRIQEGMILLGPSVMDITQEELDPLIIRNFEIHADNEGWLPEPPEKLKGQSFNPVYLSPLAQAQRESELEVTNRFLMAAGNISAVKPSVLDKIDEDKTLDLIGRVMGINPEIMRDSREVEKIRQQRAQAQAQAAQMQAMGQGAMIAKEAATAAEKTANAEAVGA